MQQLLSPALSPGKLTARLFAFIVVVVGACTNATHEPTAADFRCRSSLPDGSCSSEPANCPVTLHHSSEPRCPQGAELIPIEEDTCAHKLICVD